MLTEKTKKIIEEMDELKKIVMREFTFDMLADVDENGMIALAKCLKLMNMAMDLAEEQAAAIDLIHVKLDKLLEIKEKEKGSI